MMKKNQKYWIAAIISIMVCGISLMSATLLTRQLTVGPYLSIDQTLKEKLAQGMYVDYGFGTYAMSHSVFYYGLNRSLEYARNADILILGNSRTIMGFDNDIWQKFAEKRGLKVFHMAFGNSEGGAFPMFLINKHKLKPKIVIVNSDGFFQPFLSAAAKDLVKQNGWESFRNRPEEFAKYYYYCTIRKYLPHLLPDTRLTGNRAYLRSEKDGSWFIWHPSNDKIPFMIKETEVQSVNEKLLKEFGEEVKGWGGTLVLTYVPYPEIVQPDLETIAKLSSGIAVQPLTNGLSVYDGSHMTIESSRIFTEDFIKKFTPILDKSLSRQP
jgi:hypothetical protein